MPDIEEMVDELIDDVEYAEVYPSKKSKDARKESRQALVNEITRLQMQIATLERIIERATKEGIE